MRLKFGENEVKNITIVVKVVHGRLLSIGPDRITGLSISLVENLIFKKLHFSSYDMTSTTESYFHYSGYLSENILLISSAVNV